VVAGRQLAAADPRQQPVEDLVRQLAPPDRFALDYPITSTTGNLV
jgi:hypothetical protein